MSFVIKTTSFNNEKIIPKKYTCDGENISPALEWYDSPNDTQIVDAPLGAWNQRLIYNIHHNITKLTENIKSLPNPAKIGRNSNENYSGPCPLRREYRYYLFALNKQLESKNKVSRTNVEQLIKPYIIGEAVLIGRYERKKIN